MNGEQDNNERQHEHFTNHGLSTKLTIQYVYPF
jgi:hypothetical protein